MESRETFFVIVLMSIVSIAHAEIETHGLSAIGTVEGKTYFHDQTDMSWEAGKRRCEEGKMRLATITSPAQHEFLQKNINNGNDEYWIGARDALSHSQYVWDDDESSLNENFTNYNFPTIRSCLAFVSAWEGDSYLLSLPCTSEQFVICEIIHN